MILLHNKTLPVGSLIPWGETGGGGISRCIFGFPYLIYKIVLEK